MSTRTLFEIFQDYWDARYETWNGSIYALVENILTDPDFLESLKQQRKKKRGA